MNFNRCEIGDCRSIMRRWIAEGVKVKMCVTSPPYWGLRDYGVPRQLGLESTPEEYVANMVEVFRLVRELLADDGTLWLNLGDSYVSQPHQRGLDDLVGTKQETNAGSRSAPSRSLSFLPAKNLVGIPWRVAFALQADGWYLRQDIIWSKPNPMPESVRDRCTKSHEYLFLLSKRERYYYDADAIAEPVSLSALAQIKQGYEGEATKDFAAGGAQDASATKKRVIASMKQQLLDKQGSTRRMNENTSGARANGGAHDSPFGITRNKRSVWTVTTKPFAGVHFATFPPDLIEPCILAGSKSGDIVLDPFMGSGTTGEVAQNLGRRWLGCELNLQYATLQEGRTAQQGLIL